MANGVVRGPDGAIYASNDVGTAASTAYLDGTVTLGWADRRIARTGWSIDTSGRYLYAAQTFVPAAIARIDARRPGPRRDLLLRPPAADIAAGLDGLTRDAATACTWPRTGAARSGGRRRRPRRARWLSCRRSGPSAVAFGSARDGRKAARTASAAATST